MVAIGDDGFALSGGGAWGVATKPGALQLLDGSGGQLAEEERIGVGAVPHVVVVVRFGQMGRRAVGGDGGVAAVLVRRVGRRGGQRGRSQREHSWAFTEVMAAIVPARALLAVAVRHLDLAQRAGARVKAADDRAGALAARPGAVRPGARRPSPVSGLQDLVQQRAVEREAAAERAPVRQEVGAGYLVTHVKRFRCLSLIGTAPVTQNALLLPHHALLHHPLMVGVIETIDGPKQTAGSAPAPLPVRLLLIAVTGAAAMGAAVAPGGPAALCHIIFAVYVTAVYVWNRGAAASVCPAGWTWIEEVLVRFCAVVAPSDRVLCGHVVMETVGGRRSLWQVLQAV